MSRDGARSSKFVLLVENKGDLISRNLDQYATNHPKLFRSRNCGRGPCCISAILPGAASAFKIAAGIVSILEQLQLLARAAIGAQAENTETSSTL